MLSCLLLLLQFSALPQGEPGEAQVVVQAPDRTWGVSFSPAGFEFGKPEYSTDGKRAWVAGDGERGMIANLVLQPAGAAVTTDECRRQSDTRNGRSAKRNYRLEHSGRGPLQLTSYIVPDYQGVPINQRHVHAFLYREGYCIELELSMPRYKSRHQGKFDNALDQLQIVEMSSGRMSKPAPLKFSAMAQRRSSVIGPE